MRLAVAIIVLGALSASGCFGGGCYIDSHRLEWDDPAITATLRAMAGQANVTTRLAGTGLPLDPSLLPVWDGNATLAAVRYVWPAETPEMDVSWLTLRAPREGGVELSGIIDAHLGRARFGEHLDVFLAGVLADAADRPGVRQSALDEYDPGRNDFSDGVRVQVTAALRLDDLVQAVQAPWAPAALGQWEKEDDDWTYEARLTTWTFTTRDGQVGADAAGHVEGPTLDGPGDLEDEAPPARADLDALTARVLGQAGHGAPPATAHMRPAGRVCVD